MFSLAIGELPTYPRASPESTGAIGREYFELSRFARRSRMASSLQELVDLTVDLIFDMEGPLEDAYFVKADLASQTFVFLAQRVASHFDPVPNVSFEFAAVHDATQVLEEAGLCVDTDVAERHHLVFAPRAQQLGGGRFISKGLHAPRLDGAIGYFQASAGTFSDRSITLVSLVAEIVHLALASRH